MRVEVSPRVYAKNTANRLPTWVSKLYSCTTYSYSSPLAHFRGFNCTLYTYFWVFRGLSGLFGFLVAQSTSIHTSERQKLEISV
ncbi:hypothetical protein J2T20_000996 [Paenibacillus wynnii]|nr:hypothetical protein [Paenibacillus wynnii]